MFNGFFDDIMATVSTYVSFITGVALVISEVLPFIKAVESNGLVHSFVCYMIRKGNSMDHLSADTEHLLDDTHHESHHDTHPDTHPDTQNSIHLSEKVINVNVANDTNIIFNISSKNVNMNKVKDEWVERHVQCEYCVQGGSDEQAESSAQYEHDPTDLNKLI